MAATTQRRRRVQSRPGRTVRWDRVGRTALLGTLGVILLLYISPAKHWIEQSGTARAEKSALTQLESEHHRLERRVKELRDPQAVEREARRLGMVRQGERAYVIENAPR